MPLPSPDSAAVRTRTALMVFTVLALLAVACGDSGRTRDAEVASGDGELDAGDTDISADGDGASGEDHEEGDGDVNEDGGGSEDAGSGDDGGVGGDGGVGEDGGKGDDAGGDESPERYDAGPFCDQPDASLEPTPASCTGACALAKCSDGLRDGFETDVDCGGACAPCATGARCSAANDCASGGCSSPFCENYASSCDLRRCAPRARTTALKLETGAILRRPSDGALLVTVGAYQGQPGALLRFTPADVQPAEVVALAAPGSAIALTDDGSSLYVGTKGTTPGVLRIDVASGKADPPFSLGTNFSSTVWAKAFATIPGRSDRIGVIGAVSGSSGLVGLHIFENGQALFDPNNTKWQLNSDYVFLDVTAAYFTTPERAYTVSGAISSLDFATVDVTPSGLNAVSVRRGILPDFDIEPVRAGGKLFLGERVFVEDAAQLLGTLRGHGAVATNADGSRAYMMDYDQQTSTATINCFDTASFARTGSVVVDYQVASVGDFRARQIARWGRAGLAIRAGTIDATNTLLLLPDALDGVAGCDPDRAPLAPSPLLQAPDARDTRAQTYCLDVNRSVVERKKGLLYATIAAQDPRYANRLLSVRLDGSGFSSAHYVGSDPDAFAISEDGTTAWSLPGGAQELVSIDLAQGNTQRYAVDSWPLRNPARNLAVLPGSRDEVLLYCAKENPKAALLNLYSAGAPRFSEAMQAGLVGPHLVPIDGTQFYLGSPSRVSLMEVANSGFATKWTLPTYPGPSTGSSPVPAIAPVAGGLLFDGLSLIDPGQPALLGGLPYDFYVSRYAIAPNAKHAYRVRRVAEHPDGKSRLQLECFDMRTFTRSGTLSVDLPDPGQCASFDDDTVISMLGNTGISLTTPHAAIIAPELLNCVPGCAPDAPPPTVGLPVPTKQAPDGSLSFYDKLQVADLERDPMSGRVYASVRDSDPAQANRLLEFDADTGAVLQATDVGSNPGALAIAPDGKSVYVALARAARVVSLDLGTHKVEPRLLIPPAANGWTSPTDIQVVPGPRHELAIAGSALHVGGGSTSAQGAWLFGAGGQRSLDDGLARSSTLAVVDEDTIWLRQGFLTIAARQSDGTFRHTMVSGGVGFTERLIPVGTGKIVTDDGSVLDAHSGAERGTLPVQGGIAVSDDASKIFVVNNAGSRLNVHCVSADTLTALDSTTLAWPSGYTPGNKPAEVELLGRQGLVVRYGDATFPAGSTLLVLPRVRADLEGC